MAENYTNVNSYQDRLLQAMEIVGNQLISSVSYDKTIVCTITDNSNKKEGKYEVTDGVTTFTAYSNEINLNKDDVVYVTIPNGEYENQKIIIGKKTSDEEKPFVFQQPFDNIFDLTGNLVAEASRAELVANGEVNSVIVYENNELSEVSNFIKLGVAADFKSYVKNAIVGDYGLKITLTTISQQVNGIEPIVTERYILLDVSDMYGNPYNFESNYRQEKVVDISDIETISGIKIEFYQLQNFKDSQGNKIPYLLENTETEVFANLFVDNIEIICGLDLKDYDTDAVQIYTPNSLNYNKKQSNNDGVGVDLKRIIKTRWVHIENDVPTDMSKSNENIEYEIRWYRYIIGAAAADEYCGTYWTLIGTNIDYKQKLIELNTEIEQEKEELKNSENWSDWTEEYQTKSLLEIDEKYSTLLNRYTTLSELKQYDIMDNNKLKSGVLEFYPDVNWQQEKIKVIIFVNNIAYRSNELIFINEDEVPNKTTLLYENALEIITDDESNGNYMVYGQNDHLLDTIENASKNLKTLSLVFDGEGKGEQWLPLGEEDYKDVIWYLPKENSMLNFIGIEDVETFEINGKNLYKCTQANPQYTIRSYFSHSYINNTVIAEYTVNNIRYTTEKEFTFGPAGTMGTEQTLVIDFANSSQKAINYNVEDNETTIFKVQLYDSSNKEIEITADVSWSLWNGLDGEENYKYFEGQTSSTVVLNNKDDLNIDSLFNESVEDINSMPVLRAKIGNLETYFPIPFKLSNEYSYISGATQVIYQSNGEPSYSKETYSLYDNTGTILNDVTWELVCLDSVGAKGKEGIAIAVLSDEKNKQGYLKPIGMYLSNTRFYGIRAIHNNAICWVQPILSMQNKWASNTINKWDGQSIDINEAEGTILAPAIAAGKKHSDDNTFSGVIIGDWGNTDTQKEITKRTGVYGFNHGSMSYSFTDDGKATIGKSGLGQIKFDGDKGLIESGSFSSGKGMQIDLDEPYLFLRQSESVRLDSDITVTKDRSGNYKYSKDGTSDKVAIQVDTKFKVGWDGTLYAKNGWFEGHINGDSGSIGGWLIEDNILQSAVTNSKSIQLNSEKGTIKVGSNITLNGSSSKIIIDAANSENKGIYIYNSDSLLGSVGLITGSNDYKRTENIGLSSSTGHSIVLDSALNIGQLASNQIFLQSKDITFNAPGNNNSYFYCTTNSITGIDTSTQKKIILNVDKEHQHNIYARFA